MINDTERLVQNIINIIYYNCSQIKVCIRSEKIVYIRYTQENGTTLLDKWVTQDNQGDEKQLQCVGTKCV